jgi:hypothetical protein
LCKEIKRQTFGDIESTILEDFEYAKYYWPYMEIKILNMPNTRAGGAACISSQWFNTNGGNDAPNRD